MAESHPDRKELLAIWRDAPKVSDVQRMLDRNDLTPLERAALAALTEAAALLDTASSDGYVSEGWREDAQTWRGCWADVLGAEST